MAAILPTYGNKRINLPIRDESRQMFIIDEHESAAGHRSYTGVRLTDQIVIKEFFSNFYNWTYLNAIEIYAYNGRNHQLICKRNFDKKYGNDEDEIRLIIEEMLLDFMKGQLKLANSTVDEQSLKEQAKQVIDRSYYKLTDCDSSRLLSMAAPVLKLESANPMSNLKKAIACDV